MTRLGLLLVLVAALVAVAVILLGGEDEGDAGFGDAARHAEEEAYVPPELRGLSPSERERYLARQREAARREADRLETPAPQPSEEEVFLEGLVLAAENDEGLSQALVWLVPHREPCPHLAVGPVARAPSTSGLSPLPWGPVVTDDNGRFSFRTRNDDVPPTGTMDVIAESEGRVVGVVCAQPIPGEAILRLEKGLTIEGRVRTPGGRSVDGASVRARPGPETPATPGHGTTGAPSRTDEKGRFELGGLLPGGILVDVFHPGFMPKTVGPYDPATDHDLEITLVPALLATFEIRTDDGRDPEHLTLVWQTTDTPPRSEVLLLRVQTDGHEEDSGGRVEGEVTCVPVRLPCDARSIVLQVKADGYGTWTSEPLGLPPEGGKETFEIALTGDLATGSVKVMLEDEAGEKVSFLQTDVDVRIARIDPGARASAYVLEQQEDLRITDLPAGVYRLLLSSAAFAPAQTDVTVSAGREEEALVRVRPPAKVRVRFMAQEQTLVRFRLTQGGQTVHGIPEGSFHRGTDEATGEPILAAGSDGLLLSGLAAGTYTIEVLSEDLAAPPTVVRLVEGDTQEVEIHVRPR